MSDKENQKVELSNRGKVQLREIVYNELKGEVQKQIELLTEKAIDRTVDRKMEEWGKSKFRQTVEERIKSFYWKDIKELLAESKFEIFFKEEIKKYLEEKWSNCIKSPFDNQFHNALKEVVKDIIKESVEKWK